MKAEDVKLGMMVVPHSKSTGIVTDLRKSEKWKMAIEKNQPFLWVVAIDTREGYYGLCDINRSESYDRFLASDFEPYVTDMKRKLRIAEIKGILPKGALLGEHLIALSTDNDTLESMLYDLNNIGSDAFLERMPYHSLNVLAEGIRMKFGSKVSSTSGDKLPSIIKEETKHQQWEYLIIQVHRMSPLNSYGREGWELVTIVGYTFYFKRPCNG